MTVVLGGHAGEDRHREPRAASGATPAVARARRASLFSRRLASLRNFAGPSGPAFYCARPEWHSHTPNGAVDSEASLGRNLAVGLYAFETACNAWILTVDAAGTVSIVNAGTVVASKEIDLQGTATSCHSMANPSWLADHEQAALDTYQQAAQAHLAAVLDFVATTTLGPPAA